MSTTDLLVRIESQFQDRGFKSAEASAKTLERELNKLEHAERAMANLQIQAAREDAVRTQTRLAAMEKVGRGATAMGVATAAGYALAAKAAMDWESAWTGVTKTVDGSASDMAKLQSELRGLANTLPTTHEQIAAVAEAAGQLGVKRADVAAFTRTMIDLGETTNLTSDEAATGLAKLGNIMGVLPSQASRAGSALVALGNDGASTEQDILAMALRIGAAGRTIGLTEAQVMGFASALSSVGIEAEAGGSAISRVFVDVAQAVDKGGVQVERFARVAGMSVDSFSEKFRTDAAGAVTAFVEGLGRVEASGGSAFQTLEDLGLSEIRVRDTLLRAANASDLLRTSVDLGTKAWTDNLALTQEASKRYETAESKIKMARNQLNNAAIDVGAVVLPAFASAAESVGSLAQWFSALPEPVKHTATVLGMVASAVTLVGGTALVAIPKIQAFKVVLVEMGIASEASTARMGNFAKTAGILGAAIGATTVAGAGMKSVWLNTKGASDDAARSLEAYIKGGAEAEHVTELMRNEFTGLGNAVNNVLNPSIWHAGAAGIDEWTTAYGLFGTSATTDSIAFFRQLDVALTDFVKSGKGDQAAKVFGQITEEAKAQGYTLGQVQGLLPGYISSLDQLSMSQGGLNKSVSPTVDTVEDYVQAATAATAATKAYADAINGFASPILDAREANRQWEESIDSAAAALKENGKTLSDSTDKGRENAQALDGMTRAAIDNVGAMQANGESQGRLQQVIGESRAAIEAMAIRFGMSKDEARKYTDQLLTIPAVRATQISADTSRATAAIQGLFSYWSSRTITLRVAAQADRVGTATGGVRSFPGGMMSYAEGGSFQGQVPRTAWNQGARGVQWAETGAGAWEAWISGHPGRRQRSLAVWGDVGRKLGAFNGAGLVRSYSPPATMARSGGDEPALASAVRQALHGARLDLGPVSAITDRVWATLDLAQSREAVYS